MPKIVAVIGKPGGNLLAFASDGRVWQWSAYYKQWEKFSPVPLKEGQ